MCFCLHWLTLVSGFVGWFFVLFYGDGLLMFWVLRFGCRFVCRGFGCLDLILNWLGVVNFVLWVF